VCVCVCVCVCGAGIKLACGSACVCVCGFRQRKSSSPPSGDIWRQSISTLGGHLEDKSYIFLGTSNPSNALGAHPLLSSSSSHRRGWRLHRRFIGG
jgi:hypothetical protein